MSEKTVQTVRAMNYMAGVLRHHGNEPMCRDCKSYAAVVATVRETLKHFLDNVNAADIPENFRSVFEDAEAVLKNARVADDPVPRRKTGDCTLPDKRCFLKHTRKFFEECTKHD